MPRAVVAGRATAIGFKAECWSSTRWSTSRYVPAQGAGGPHYRPDLSLDSGLFDSAFWRGLPATLPGVAGRPEPPPPGRRASWTGAVAL